MKATYLPIYLCLFLIGMFSNTLQAQEVQFGEASYYADKYHNQSTSSGELYNKNAMTAAHRKLPFGTMVKVTRLDNNKSVVVRINDRGPYKDGRVIDLSRAAAEKINLVQDGIADVKVEVINKDEERKLTEKPKESKPKATAVKSTSTSKPKPSPKKKTSSTKTKSSSSKKFTTTNVMSGTYKVSLERVPETSFGVQVGTFSNYEYMMNQVAQLHDYWFKDVIISIGNTNGKKSYKVIVGSLSSREAAEQYKANVMKKTGLRGFVVDLNEL